MQLQLSLNLADRLYDLLLLQGEPLDFLSAAEQLLALTAAPSGICFQIMDTLVLEDRRFCWTSPSTIGLRDWSLDDPDLATVPFVVVDLETTGMRAGCGKITEIGAVRIEGLQEVACFETLVNPRRPIAPKVIELTGITPSMLRDAPGIEEVMPRLLEFLQGAVIVGHNAHFDVSFLNYELTRLNGCRLGAGAIDTLGMARRLAPGLPNHRLGTVADALGSPVCACHRALADAQATAHVFLTFIGRLQEMGFTRLNEVRRVIDPSHKLDHHKLALTSPLPRTPGTYMFVDEEGEILYVGKAERLRDRVRSYFLTGAEQPRKVRQAVRRMHEVRWEEAGSPLEAVAREQELIVSLRPSCNVFGRRPENYVYLKVAGRGSGLRLYASDRPPDFTSAAGATDKLAAGPFRGKKRVSQALDLIHRCYPIRRCLSPDPTGCLYAHTGHCLAPCSGSDEARAENDAIVLDLLAWITDGEKLNGTDPLARARDLMRSRSQEGRFEAAQQIREALDDLSSLRRSYRALLEARSLRTAVLWRIDGHERPVAVRVNVVWDGLLLEPFEAGKDDFDERLEACIATTEPHLRAADTGPALLAVAQEQLDSLLAVRRWLLDHPETCQVPLAGPHSQPLAVDRWKERLRRRAAEMLGAD